MTRTSASVVPGRATSTKSTGTRYSPTIRRPAMFASASCVALTPPSMLFSIAIIAPTLRPEIDIVERLAHVVDRTPDLVLGLRHLRECRPGEGPRRAEVAVRLGGGLRHGSEPSAASARRRMGHDRSRGAISHDRRHESRRPRRVRRCFTEDALLSDWGKEFRGHEGVASWDRTDNIGRSTHFEVAAAARRATPVVTLKSPAAASTARATSPSSSTATASGA